MKRFEFNNLPTGSIILIKRYNLWQRFKAFLTKKPLPYNDVFIVTSNKPSIRFDNKLFVKCDVTAFMPKKPYNKTESKKVLKTSVSSATQTSTPVEKVLLINLVRPNTFHGITLEELLENNKFYKKQIV